MIVNLRVLFLLSERESMRKLLVVFTTVTWPSEIVLAQVQIGSPDFYHWKGKN